MSHFEWGGSNSYVKAVGKEVLGRKRDNAGIIQSKVALRMSSKMPDAPPKWSTNEDGFKDNHFCIEGILSTSAASCTASCNRLTECGAAQGVGLKAIINPDEESSGACSGGNKGRVKEGFAINDVAVDGQYYDKEILTSTITIKASAQNGRGQIPQGTFTRRYCYCLR